MWIRDIDKNKGMYMEKQIARIFEIKVKNMKVILDEVEKPSGAYTRRLLIDYPHAVAIIPLLGPDKFILVKQFRYALNKETLEFPAGKIDPGETLEQAVRRELQEETGYDAENLVKLSSYTPAMGYSSEIIHLFLATKLFKSKTDIDPDEISEVTFKTKKELWNIINNSEAIDPKILIGFLLGEKLGYF